MTLTNAKAGANLMGSDLYNNLIRYFVTHLKGLREVSIDIQWIWPNAEWRLLRKPTRCKMRHYCGITLVNGRGIPLAPTISTDFSHISIGIG